MTKSKRVQVRSISSRELHQIQGGIATAEATKISDTVLLNARRTDGLWADVG